MKKNKSAFTLMELLVVIAIIGILASISILALNGARARSRDERRIADLKQVSTALEMFFNDTRRYPTANEWASGELVFGGTTYLKTIPTAPNPPDGSCSSAENAYSYTQVYSDSYTISFCLGSDVGALASGGPKCASSEGLSDAACGSGGSGYSCVGPVVYGGESYPVIDINGQCWLAKNLNVGTFISSSNTDNGSDGNPGTNDDCIQTPSGWGWWSCQGYTGVQKYCQDNDVNNCNTDGGLYEWAEAVGLPSDCNDANATDNNDGTYTLACPLSGNQTLLTKPKGICPTGWHVASDLDWSVLETYLANDPGYQVKLDSGVWGDSSNNSSGLSIIPAAYRVMTGDWFFDNNADAFFWSATPYPTAYFSYNRHVHSGYPEIFRNGDRRAYGFSVRCMKD